MSEIDNGKDQHQRNDRGDVGAHGKAADAAHSQARHALDGAQSERLSAYLDGELTAPQREQLEREIAADPRVAQLLAGLRAVRNQALSLADRPPQQDLWPAIAARTAMGRRRPHPGAGRRYALSLPQLAAAAVVLIVLSSALTAVLSGALRFGQRGTQPATGQATSGENALAWRVRQASFAQREYDKAIRDLEHALAQQKGRIDSTTYNVIVKNLAIVDLAVTQTRAALVQDPQDEYLNAYLASTMQRKLKLLRQASALADVPI
jgi:hypothetical protein